MKNYWNILLLMIILSEFLSFRFYICQYPFSFQRSLLLLSILWGSLDQIRDRLPVSAQIEDD
jgi:hypothetical protein